jgi:hypothetical protein
VPVVPLEERTLDYSREPLMWDRGFRQDLLDGLVELGCAVEGAFDGVPQDIEGCWHDGRFAVVQSRPQVLTPAPPPPAAAAGRSGAAAAGNGNGGGEGAAAAARVARAPAGARAGGN